MATVKCPFCGSDAIFRLRRDSDYGGGQYYETVNEESCYEGVRRYTPDVDLYHCKKCDCFFDPAAMYPNVKVVTVSALQEAISNLEKHIQWLTGTYKAACQSVRLRIEKGTLRDMGTSIAREFPDLEKACAEIEKFNEQAKLLSHIIEKHTVSLPTICTGTSEEEET